MDKPVVESSKLLPFLVKQLTLRWNLQFRGFGAVGVVILDLVDPSAHWVSTHRTCVRRE